MTATEADAAAVILDHVWVGAGIHIHTGGPAEAGEPFLPWRDLPDDPDAVFALLSWHARLVPLVGREKDRDGLLQWARRGRNARIRLLTARAESARVGSRPRSRRRCVSRAGPPASFAQTIRSSLR